jgi:hypothetical protein
LADQHIEIRPITEDEWPAWEHSAARAFGEHSDPVMQAFIRSITEIERILDAFQNGRVVGSAASHTFELTVPGAHVPFPFVDIVTVQAYASETRSADSHDETADGRFSRTRGVCDRPHRIGKLNLFTIWMGHCRLGRGLEHLP